MSVSYESPQGYENPVPEPGERGPRRQVNLPSLSTRGWLTFARIIFFLVAFAFVVKGPIRDAIQSVSPASLGGGSAKVDGTVNPVGSNVSATYTPADGETANVSQRDGIEFHGTEWNLVKGDESIFVRDYRFTNSPVASKATIDDYYAVSGNQLNMTAGHDVKPTKLTVDGREGRVWQSRADDGRWVLLAEFPGDPHTIRMQCNAASVESVIVRQCKEVLRTLRFGE